MSDLVDSIKLLPLVYKFRICPLGGDNIEVENNQWFCHAKDVEALKKQAKVTINQLVELVAEMHAVGNAVVKRWDSPSWKDLPHTADYIHALRNKLTKADALLTKLGDS